MAEIIVKFEGLDDLKKKLKSETAAAPCRRFLERSGRSVISKAKPLAPVNTGKLKKSLLSTVSNETPVPLSVTIGTNLVYAPFVEFGRKPGKMPPYEPINFWFRRKNKIGMQKSTFKRSTEFGDVVTSVDSTVFLIRRAIGRKGVAEQPFLRDGTDQAKEEIQGHVTTLGREIEEAYRSGSL